MKLPRSPKVRTQRVFRRKIEEQTNLLGVHHQIHPSSPKLKENSHQRLEPNEQQRPEGTVPKKTYNRIPMHQKHQRNISRKQKGTKSEPNIVTAPHTSYREAKAHNLGRKMSTVHKLHTLRPLDTHRLNIRQVMYYKRGGGPKKTLNLSRAKEHPTDHGLLVSENLVSQLVSQLVGALSPVNHNASIK